jgi:hypothetical protein
LDFATAEALAFGSMMLEGNDVRISGQDVGRGTFSHRHAMLVNQQTEGVVVPLNDVLQAQGKLELANSESASIYITMFFLIFTELCFFVNSQVHSASLLSLGLSMDAAGRDQIYSLSGKLRFVYFYVFLIIYCVFIYKTICSSATSSTEPKYVALAVQS